VAQFLCPHLNIKKVSPWVFWYGFCWEASSVPVRSYEKILIFFSTFVLVGCYVRSGKIPERIDYSAKC
jgi:hypothetical protein